ncbi:MAG: cobalamin-dependent protein [Deltaproteobacteria bacterium]|nr:cobalamin-dependent protein [Deltaproteobacteria bacterium]
MNVLLISTNRLTVPYPVYPLGLDYVAGAIAHRHRVRIADMNILRDAFSLEEIIRDFSPAVIGISLRNIDTADSVDPRAFIDECADIARVIKQCSAAILVCGGSGFTLFPKEILKAMNADYGIIGEGERLPLLLDALERGEDVADIPGVVMINFQNRIPEPWDREPVRDFQKEYSHLPFYLKKGGMLNLQTKRGCHFKCIYCSYPHIEGRNLRFVSPEKVAETAIKLQEAGAKYLFITDSAFNADIPQSIAVAEAFKKAGLSIPWGAFFAPVKLPDHYFRIMADAGMTHVEFGTESLSDVMLTSYRKPFLTAHVFETHKQAVNAGVHVAHYFLLGGPKESPDTVNETLLNVAELKKSVFFFFCGVRIYPHTELYDLALKEGSLSESPDILNPVFYSPMLIDPDKIVRCVEEQAKSHSNWVVGSGGKKTAKIVGRMHDRGHIGPLWDLLIS